MLKQTILATWLFFAVYSFVHAHGTTKHSEGRIKLSPLSMLKLGPYDQGASEIVSYDPTTQRAFVTNGYTNAIDVISLRKPASPKKEFSIDLKPFGVPNSVAVKQELVAVAVAAKPKQNPGSVVVFDVNGKHLNTFEVGALPDMVTFTPNGKFILSANEGEPNDDYSNDPEGSVSIISVSDDINAQTQSSVRTADFSSFNSKELDPEVRVFGPGASAAEDFEPEYITVSADSKSAWVSLQENNALALLDIENGVVTQVLPLGTRSHNNTKTAIDASDKDQGINIKPWPIEGLYQPDTIASYQAHGKTYIVTANEGDARDYTGYSEESRVATMSLDKSLLDSSPNLKSDENLGRLKVSTVGADINGDGRADKLYSFGTRSFSIWNTQGQQVFDSSSQFERITARNYPRLFNLGDGRSDDKGPEPEALAVGKVGDSIYAFIGLERTGGVMVYNITKPKKAFYVDYLNTISPQLEADDPNAGDIAPESIVFVSAKDSPNDQPFIITANETSGTLALYGISQVKTESH